MQSQVPRDWIGAGAVFHSPEVLGSRGDPVCVLAGVWRLRGQGTLVLEWTGRDLCHHAVFITIALQYSFRSGMVIPPEVILSLRRVFAILGFLLFHMNLQFALSNLLKN